MSIPLPPLLPAEYSYQFAETYYAECIQPSCTGVVTNNVETTGTAFWSLQNLATRAFISGAAGGFVARETVTNYTDTASGSLVIDQLGERCIYYGVEGGASYPGQNSYQLQIQQAIGAGIPVSYGQVAHYYYKGNDYGPLDMWSLVLPDPDPTRVLQYTVGFTPGTSFAIVYAVNGTESLPLNATIPTSPQVLVRMHSENVRHGYNVYPSDFNWNAQLPTTGNAASFFSTACPFASPVTPAPASPCSDCAGKIAGGAVGGLFLGALIATVLMWFLVCKKRRDQKSYSNGIENAVEAVDDGKKATRVMSPLVVSTW